MKKIFAILAITASTSAFAVGPTVTLSHTRDFGTETKLDVAQSFGNFGTVDAALLATRYSIIGGQGTDNANGFEAGYTNGITYGGFGITARGAFGRLNNIDKNGGGFTGNTSYVSLTTEASYPVATRVNAFIGYRYRNPIAAADVDGPNQNRFQAGADVAITKNIGARVGVSHARQAGQHGTGVLANVNYSF